MGGGGGRKKFAAGVDEFLRQGGVVEPIDRGPRNQKKVGTGRHQGLVLAENLAQAALGAVALDGAADGSNGGDHADAGEAGWTGLGVTPEKPDGEGAAVDPATLLPYGAKITRAPQMLLRAEAHEDAARAGERGQTTVRRLRPLSRRDLMTLRPPRVAMRAR